MKTLKKIDELLVGVEFDTPIWHMLHILRMNAVQDEMAIQEAMEEILETPYEDDCPLSIKCHECKYDKLPYMQCVYLHIINKHTGIEPMPKEER